MNNTLFIKNMVCPRCIMAVEETMEKLEINFLTVKLGEVVLEKPLTTEETSKLQTELKRLGFELLNDKKTQLIEKIKSAVIRLVHHNKELNVPKNLSEYIPRELGYNYSSLSKLFSETVGITIEKYFILQKIEKVKELLIYDELTISEIAYRLEYSSNQHLSAQFKKETGITPSEFKKMNNRSRKSLDEI